jgi:hypothetical protein
VYTYLAVNAIDPPVVLGPHFVCASKRVIRMRTEIRIAIRIVVRHAIVEVRWAFVDAGASPRGLTGSEVVDPPCLSRNDARNMPARR